MKNKAILRKYGNRTKREIGNLLGNRNFLKFHLKNYQCLRNRLIRINAAYLKACY